MPADDPAGPDWAGRLLRAIWGLGLVWLVVGTSITLYHLTAGDRADIDRGAALMILGAATFTLGVILYRRARPSPPP